MGTAKKIDFKRLFQQNNILIFLFLVIFPFGQITRITLSILGYDIPVLPIDIIAGMGAVYSLFNWKSHSPIYKYIIYILSAFAFTSLLSIFVFGKETLYGLFYLIRFSSYAIFFEYIWNFTKKIDNKKLLLDSTLIISVISVIFGWIQFFVFPDLKPFTVWNWDMHLYRLAGTFLDPTFLGIIIVFGLIQSINLLIEKRSWKNILISLFLLISLAFTYSRACYLAFAGGIITLAFFRKDFRNILYWILGLGVLMLLLPTAKNHSIELTRMFSVLARVENYQSTLKIIEKYPVFGVGYNNMCVARNRYIESESFKSHSCSGSDSSILLLLATTGIVGFGIFLTNLVKIFKLAKKSKVFPILASSTAALFIHSLFSNSLFYPWVWSYFLILLAVCIKE